MATKSFIAVIGNNEFGELASDDYQHCLDLKYIPNDNNIEEIYCGFQYTIFANVRQQQFSVCGDNQYGQCGIDNTQISALSLSHPTLVQHFQQNNLLITKVHVNVSGQCTFWTTHNSPHNLYANGLNENHQLGLAVDTINKCTPTLVHSLRYVKDVSSSAQFCAALCGNGAHIVVAAWNSRQSLPSEITDLILAFYGDNQVYVSSYRSSIWSRLSHLDDKSIKSIETGRYHALFLRANGRVFAFGDNGQCQLGVQAKSARIPLEVAVIINVKEIACGWYHNLAVTMNKRIYSWGYNQFGQCGNNTVQDIKKPRIIDRLKAVQIRRIVCGAYHSAAQTQENEWYFWGSNKFNECIVGKQEENILRPTWINEKAIVKIDDCQCVRIKRVFLGYHNTRMIVVVS